MKLSRVALAACALACAIPAAPAAAGGCSAGNCAWSLTNDWLAAWAGKDASTPPSPTFADGYGDPGVWAMREGGAADAPLQGQADGESASFESGMGTPDGTFDIWHGLTEGSFGANLGANPQNYATATIAPHTVDIHPSGAYPRQIDWTDPIPGTSVVSVSGGVTDDDGNGGDGVGWEIWLNGTRLASGLLPNGPGSHQSFTATDAGAALSSITVNQGDQLRLVITAGPAQDPYYDTTQVDFDIFQANGAGTTGQTPPPPPAPPAFAPTLQSILSDGSTSVPLYAGSSIQQGANLTITPQCTNAADIQQCQVQVDGPAGAGVFSTGEQLPDQQPGDYVANVLAVNSAGTPVSASFGFKVLSRKDYALLNARTSLASAVNGGAAPGQVSGGKLLKGGASVPVTLPEPGTIAGIIAAGSGNIIGAGAGNIIAAGSGNIIGAGAGNIIAAGSGNIIAAGSGNIIAAGSGNIIAAGSGNIINAGAHNRAFAAVAKPVLLGGGSHVFRAAGRSSMRLRLSKKGRALIAAYERRARSHHKLAPLRLGYVLYFRSAKHGSPAYFTVRTMKVVR